MRLRVLVAEDDPVFRALICDIVRQQGVRTGRSR